MSYIIGLTGGIGCGKSLISQYLLEKGYQVIDADRIARQIMEPGQQGLRQTVEAFGVGILTAKGTLDRQKLGNIVFSDTSQLKKLDQITHPLIRQEVEKAILLHQEQAILILDIPLLFESGNYSQMVDEIWVVTATEAQQIERIMKRDHLTETQAQARMDKQWPTARKAAYADRVIDNAGDRETTYQQVDEFLSNVNELLRIGFN